MYRPTTTIGKAAIPIIVLATAEACISAARSRGVELDRVTVLWLAMGLYGALKGLRNWWKNRGR